MRGLNSESNKWILYSSLPKALLFFTLLFLLVPQLNRLLMQPKTRRIGAKPDPSDKDTLLLETGDDYMCPYGNYTITYFADPTGSLYKFAVIDGFEPLCSTTNVTESFELPIMNITAGITSGVLCNGSEPLFPINESEITWELTWSAIELGNDENPCEAAILYSDFNSTSNSWFIQCVEREFQRVTQQFIADDDSCYQDQMKEILLELGENLLWIGVVAVVFCYGITMINKRCVNRIGDWCKSRLIGDTTEDISYSLLDEPIHTSRPPASITVELVAHN